MNVSGISGALVILSCALRAAAFGQTAVTGSWKPPVIPIELSYDSETGFDMQCTGEVITPLGTFSGSLRKVDLDDRATYFLVTNGSQEDLFCIGEHGGLELLTEGENRITVSNVSGYRNVIRIDCESISGKVSLTFKPDDTKPELARIRLRRYHIVLNADGSVLFDGLLDRRVKKRDVQEVVWSDFPSQRNLVFSLIYKDDGTKTFTSIACENQSRIEALWWIACFRHNNGKAVEELTLDRNFGECLYLFECGSMLLPIGWGTWDSVHLGGWRAGQWLIPREFIAKVQLYHTSFRGSYVIGLKGPSNSEGHMVFEFCPKGSRHWPFEGMDNFEHLNDVTSFVNAARRRLGGGVVSADVRVVTELAVVQSELD
jgi:hypothetical protein